jgi:hypothetical protein
MRSCSSAQRSTAGSGAPMPRRIPKRSSCQSCCSLLRSIRCTDAVPTSVTGAEGGVLLKQHLRRERDPKLKPEKIAQAKRRGVPIACEVCGFDFFKTYGERGRDYIECHHRTPLHVTGPVTTSLNDLALICSNCHRMIHRSNPWLTVEQLAMGVANGGMGTMVSGRRPAATSRPRPGRARTAGAPAG